MMKSTFGERYKSDHTHPLNKLCHSIGIPMIVGSIIILFFNFKLGVGVFILGWILQFIGHFIEGNKPAFFKNPIYLLVGPLWVLKHFKNLTPASRASKPEKRH